jgi:HK97 family phage portal protein
MPILSQTSPRGWLASLRSSARNALAAATSQLSPPATDTKAIPLAPYVSVETLKAPQWAPRDYKAFAREGFMQNAVVYRCVRMIAENVASVPLLVYDGAIDLDAHPLLDLVKRPNAHATRADFLEELIGYLLVSGNAFVEAVSTDGEMIRALYNLRPDRMSIEASADGWPDAYIYSLAGRDTRFTGDAVPGTRRILHLKQFHPLNDHYGMSPIEAAAQAIDLHNTASRWNKALLDNSARPSGALVYTARDGNLTNDQFERLKRELEQGFQGAQNAGRPLLLEGGLDWKAMSLSPKDLDFIEAKHAAAREIALSLGVPPQLLGIPGDNTYANYQEANRAFFRQTIVPLVNRITSALTHWLAEPLSPTLAIKPDFDQVDALTPERDALWSRLAATSFLTTNEKRQAAGYDPTPTGDTVKRVAIKYSPDHPRDDRGRWTDGGADDTTLDDSTDGNRDPNVIDAAKKPRPPTDTQPKPAAPTPRADYGTTPGGSRFTKHARDQATERNFTDQRIDAIVQNNAASRTSKIDREGNKTWEYRDARGNTVVTNEQGAIVTVFSQNPKGIYIEK